MTHSSLEHDDGAQRRRGSAAGRLLLSIREQGTADLNEIATRARIPMARLDACANGSRSLEPLLQMRLAAVVVDAVPALRREAHALYGQAQAALALELGADRRHETYPREFFR